MYLTPSSKASRNNLDSTQKNPSGSIPGLLSRNIIVHVEKITDFIPHNSVVNRIQSGP